MTDPFEARSMSPMLIGADSAPFDSDKHLFELKLDGERAIAYLGPGGAELRNKRDKRMLPVFPELGGIHRQVKGRCILDGEFVLMKGGKPNFSELQRRSLMAHPFKIRLAAEKLPVSLIAFDILYLEGRALTGLPLCERRALLEKTVAESERLALSRYVEREGKALFSLAAAQGLEGVVAKPLAGRYYPGKRTKEWVKVKNLLDDDFVVCGYLFKENHMASLVLGQYRGGALAYQGHVTLGVSGANFKRVQAGRRRGRPPLPLPEGGGNEGAVWLEPELVCTVKYLERTPGGGVRHPVFKGLREDKDPRECVWAE